MAIGQRRGEDALLARRTTSPLDTNPCRKKGSRERLLAAAAAAFCERGYFGVSVEDIASAAGVSRMTFYRHFNGKASVAAELFRINTGSAMPLLLSIGEADFRDAATVRDWIAALFASDRASRQLLRVFTQASVSEPSFTTTAHRFIDNLLLGLGRTIPAFALAPDKPGERRRWVEAWLLIYEILDQSNHAALESGVATDPLTIDILADRFLAFTRVCFPIAT
ncbi:MAG TPA: TetR/AcrR family transcriptional regulator [Sphingobium sp.]